MGAPSSGQEKSKAKSSWPCPKKTKALMLVTTQAETTLLTNTDLCGLKVYVLLALSHWNGALPLLASCRPGCSAHGGPHLSPTNMQIAFHCLQHNQHTRGWEVVLEVSVRGAETGIGALGKQVVITLGLRRQPVFQGILKFMCHLFLPASCLMSMLRSFHVICGWCESTEWPGMCWENGAFGLRRVEWPWHHETPSPLAHLGSDPRSRWQIQSALSPPRQLLAMWTLPELWREAAPWRCCVMGPCAPSKVLKVRQQQWEHGTSWSADTNVD